MPFKSRRKPKKRPPRHPKFLGLSPLTEKPQKAEKNTATTAFQSEHAPPSPDSTFEQSRQSEPISTQLPAHSSVQMHPLLQRNAFSPTNHSQNSLLNHLTAKHEASIQRALKEETEGGQSSGAETQAKPGPITYTFSEGAKGKFNNTGLTFRHADGKPLTAEEVYRFIRDQKSAGNNELMEMLPMRSASWYKERGQEPPRFTIENSEYTYYGYAGNGSLAAASAKGADQTSGGPTLSILDWPKAQDFQIVGSPAGTDNRNHYQIVQGYYVLTQTQSSGDRYFYLPVSEKGKPGADWTPFTPKGLAAKQARDADPQGLEQMRAIANGWTGLVEADYSEIGHTVLDYIGMVPILGEGADIINAIWYTAEGNYLDAFLSSGAAVPIAGWAFTVFKRGRAVQKIFNRGGKIVVENLVNKADEAVEGSVKVGNDVVEEASEKLGKEIDSPKIKQDAPEAKTPKDADSPKGKPETQTPKEYSEGEVDKLKKQDENSPVDETTKKSDPNYASKQQARAIAESILTQGDEADVHPSNVLPLLWGLTIYKGVRGFSFVPIGQGIFQFYLHGTKEKLPPKDGLYDVKVEKENVERKYEANPKHGSVNRGKANKAPTNPQLSLDNSFELPGNTTRRVAADKSAGEFNVFDEHTPGNFHGHSRSWEELSQEMKNVLISNSVVNRKGKIL